MTIFINFMLSVREIYLNIKIKINLTFIEVVNRIEFKSKVNRIRLKIESNLNLN